MGGVCAAVGAAKEKARVLLIERYGFLGGMATAGLVKPFMSYRTKDRRLTSAVFNEILYRLQKMSALDVSGQVFDLFSLFKSSTPRFKNAYLIKIAPQIGVRESRRVFGKYKLTMSEVIEGCKYPDGIARSNYPIDIHNPIGEGTSIQHLQPGDYYEVPYRCLVPKDIKNLIVGSRCISATHEAHSSLRVMPVVAGIGEAAGLAAAWAVQQGILPSRIDGKKLKASIFHPNDEK
jgi:hypothetical protein